ncbi:hypothetical protein DRW42_09405 [Pedobacter miscanthi]|uniref:Uncharacterized protein n=1 Tax=Pedobacter miscanthi TaxID=2259170 RepID=A0A366L207_9SPHI|nr:hypothetical protein DRW42_09405 [Pedobacter miscanthi]
MFLNSSKNKKYIFSPCQEEPRHHFGTKGTEGDPIHREQLKQKKIHLNLSLLNILKELQD